MKRRCRTKTDDNYHYYGGRGIKVCKRWDDFINFLKDMGIRPPHKTLDRVNNNGDYKPSNCKWSTRKQQANNNRKQARWSHCKRGHKLMAGNLYYFSNGSWRCKACVTRRGRERGLK